VSVLEARGLRYAIGGRLLLSDFDLTVGPGERVAVVGPSGSGKTSLLALLAGLCWHVARRASTADAEHQRQQEHLEHQAIELEEQAVELEEQVETLGQTNEALLAAEAAATRAHRTACSDVDERFASAIALMR